MTFAGFVAACARILADGDGTPADLARRWRTVFALPRSHRWPDTVAATMAGRFAAGRPRVEEARAALAADAALRRAWRAHHPVATGLPPAAAMWPSAGPPAGWRMPAWTTLGQLASNVGCTIDALGWLAGGRPGRTLPSGPRHQYRYRWIAKASGGQRLVEEPKDWLKAVQRGLLRALVDRFPVHAAAHAYVAGRSARGFALPHVGRHVVVRLDLVDFFPSIRGARVLGLLALAGFPPRVARVIAGLCTNRTPDAVLAGRGVERARYRTWHLPQGAPTSPGLANACCYRLDCRLDGLARAAGAAYTRYADDLVFSGDREFSVHLDRFLVRAHAIVIAEGFALKERKTRIMRRGARQRVGGLVVNQRARVPRADRERLEAILVNCARGDPRAQNRDGHLDFRAHLLGRIAWVAQHDARDGERLRAIFARIVWPQATAPG